MKPPGNYKLRYHDSERAFGVREAQFEEEAVENALVGVAQTDLRAQRIVASLRDEILDAGEEVLLRVRQIFSAPREIYRLEIERPDLGYQRITLLDREALEALLEVDEVRSLFELALSA